MTATYTFDVFSRLDGFGSCGSLSLNWALLAAGLVDRVQVTIFPVITGRTGTDPVFAGAADFDLELLENRSWSTDPPSTDRIAADEDPSYLLHHTGCIARSAHPRQGRTRGPEQVRAPVPRAARRVVRSIEQTRRPSSRRKERLCSYGSGNTR